MKNIRGTKCPICEEEIEIDEGLEIGDTTYCIGCGEELEVVSITPLKVKEVEITEEEFDKEEQEEEQDEE